MINDIDNKEAGFTLIELLVAFVLLGLLMSLLYGSFTFANRVTARTADNSQNSFEVVQTQDFLRELLGSIYPQKNIFRGTSDQMTFLAPLNRQGIAGGLYKMTLQRVQMRGLYDLSLSWEALIKQNHQGDDTEGSLILMENAESMEFSYVGEGGREAQIIWSSQWDQEGNLPSHVKIKLKKGGSEVGDWPEQIIKIKVTQNVDCLYDPVSRGCVYR